MTHPAPYKVAAVQAAPVFLDLDGTIDKTIALIEEAAGNDAKLIAFPETWVPGYPWWIWLGSPAWGMQFVQRYHDNSLAVDSPQMSRVCEAAKQNSINVVLGYSEKAGGSLFMGQCLVSDQGEMIFARRKLKPTHVERTVFGEGDGSDFQVADTDIGRIGALCCWEHLQPLSKYAMYSMNEQVHVAAWPSFTLYTGMAHALGAEVNTAAAMIYAVEGQCFVLSPTNFTSQEMVDMLVDEPTKAQLLTVGGGAARIYAPDGQEIGTPLSPDKEGLMYADIDLSMISLAKSAADPAGHYSRPDVTRLLLDTSPKPRVESMSKRRPETGFEPVLVASEPDALEEAISDSV